MTHFDIMLDNVCETALLLLCLLVCAACEPFHALILLLD